MKEKNTRTQIAIPGGELEKSTTNFLKKIGIEFETADRQYLINAKNIPLDLVVFRASDVPRLVKDIRAPRLVSGITGSDILWESGMDKTAGEKLPINEILPAIQQPYLFIGLTRKYERKIKQTGKTVTILSLEGKGVSTKFPNITKETLNERGVKEFILFSAPGKTESFQYIFDCPGIIDVVESGKTRKANKIIELERFHPVTTRLISEKSKMSQQDKTVLDDIRDKVEIALQKRRME